MSFKSIPLENKLRLERLKNNTAQRNVHESGNNYPLLSTKRGIFHWKRKVWSENIDESNNETTNSVWEKCVFGKDWFWIQDYCEMFQKPLASDNVEDKSEVFITWIRNPEMFFHDNSLIKQVNARKSNIYVMQLTLSIDLAQSISSVLYRYISNNLLFFTSCVSKCEFPRLRKKVLVRPHFKSGSKLDIRNCKNLLLGQTLCQWYCNAT